MVGACRENTWNQTELLIRQPSLVTLLLFSGFCFVIEVGARSYSAWALISLLRYFNSAKQDFASGRPRQHLPPSYNMEMPSSRKQLTSAEFEH